MNKLLAGKQDLATLLEAYCQEWLTLARSTEPLDYALIEQAVSDLYAAYDKPFPRLVFCRSPLELYMSAQVLLSKNESLTAAQAVDKTLVCKEYLE
ncbi:MAG: hypothetical protein K2Z81_21055, partial [Cyanobacteria bacterium]|nr:hypothetical protein [Cyanobacteriota bacterium]